MDTIRTGSPNVEAVVMLQELLKKAGYDLDVDGATHVRAGAHGFFLPQQQQD